MWKCGGGNTTNVCKSCANSISLNTKEHVRFHSLDDIWDWSSKYHKLYIQSVTNSISPDLKKHMCVFTLWMTSGTHHPIITNFVFNLSRTLSLPISKNICAFSLSGWRHPGLIIQISQTLYVCVCVCVCVCVYTRFTKVMFTNITNFISCRESFRKKTKTNLTCVGALDCIPGVIFVAESHEPTSFALCVWE